MSDMAERNQLHAFNESVEKVAAVRNYFARNGTRVELDEMRILTKDEINELYNGIPADERNPRS